MTSRWRCWPDPCGRSRVWMKSRLRVQGPDLGRRWAVRHHHHHLRTPRSPEPRSMVRGPDEPGLRAVTAERPRPHRPRKKRKAHRAHRRRRHQRRPAKNAQTNPINRLPRNLVMVPAATGVRAGAAAGAGADTAKLIQNNHQTDTPSSGQNRTWNKVYTTEL